MQKKSKKPQSNITQKFTLAQQCSCKNPREPFEQTVPVLHTPKYLGLVQNVHSSMHRYSVKCDLLKISVLYDRKKQIQFFFPPCKSGKSGRKKKVFRFKDDSTEIQKSNQNGSSQYASPSHDFNSAQLEDITPQIVSRISFTVSYNHFRRISLYLSYIH